MHAHSYRADEILMLIRVAEEMGFKIATFQHVLEGYKVAKEIAAHGAGASTFSDWWAYKIEAEDAIPYNAAFMTRKGVLVSVNSDSAELARRLNTEAAKSMKWGDLTEDEALALVTINPAKQLRIDARVGSLEAGKDADVVVWNHHPLSSYAIADRVYIDGTLYYDRLAEDKRLTDLTREKADLVAAGGSRRARPVAGTEQRDAGSTVPPPQPDLQNAGQHRAAQRPRPAPCLGDHERHDPPDQRSRHRSRHDRGSRYRRSRRSARTCRSRPGPQTIDGSGEDVYPGFINARTQMGLNEPGPRGFEDVNEMLDYNPQLRTRVAYHVESDTIPVTRANGITTVAVVPSGGIFGGEVAVMNLDGWTWEDATLRPNAGHRVQLPADCRRPAGAAAVVAEDARRAAECAVRSAEEAARRSARRDRAALRSGAGVRESGPDKTEGLGARRARAGGRAAAAACRERRRESDIRDAVAFADRVKVNIVISGGAEAAIGRIASEGTKHPGRDRQRADARRSGKTPSTPPTTSSRASSPRPA